MRSCTYAAIAMCGARNGMAVTAQDREIARELRDRLARHVSLVDLRVFGSRAREDGESGSDMDVFVEVSEVTPQIRDLIADIAWEVGIEHLIHISPLVFSKEEIEHSPLGSSPVVLNIMREGQEI